MGQDRQPPLEAEGQFGPEGQDALAEPTWTPPIAESSFRGSAAPHEGHGGAGLCAFGSSSSNTLPHCSQRYSKMGMGVFLSVELQRRLAPTGAPSGRR
jgi:hypothetical protein